MQSAIPPGLQLRHSTPLWSIRINTQNQNHQLHGGARGTAIRIHLAEAQMTKNISLRINQWNCFLIGCGKLEVLNGLSLALSFITIRPAFYMNPLPPRNDDASSCSALDQLMDQLRLHIATGLFSKSVTLKSTVQSLWLLVVIFHHQHPSTCGLCFLMVHYGRVVLISLL